MAYNGEGRQNTDMELLLHQQTESRDILDRDIDALLGDGGRLSLSTAASNIASGSTVSKPYNCIPIRLFFWITGSFDRNEFFEGWI